MGTFHRLCQKLMSLADTGFGPSSPLSNAVSLPILLLTVAPHPATPTTGGGETGVWPVLWTTAMRRPGVPPGSGRGPGLEPRRWSPRRARCARWAAPAFSRGTPAGAWRAPGSVPAGLDVNGETIEIS